MLFYFEDGARLAQALEQLDGHAHVAPQALAVKAADGQSDDFVARSGHFFHFHASLGSHEQDAPVGMTTAHLAGDGQGGENVSAGAAAADENVDLLFVISRHF